MVGFPFDVLFPVNYYLITFKINTTDIFFYWTVLYWKFFESISGFLLTSIKRLTRIRLKCQSGLGMKSFATGETLIDQNKIWPSLVKVFLLALVHTYNRLHARVVLCVLVYSRYVRPLVRVPFNTWPRIAILSPEIPVKFYENRRIITSIEYRHPRS